jgi:hypothetical protein
MEKCSEAAEVLTQIKEICGSSKNKTLPISLLIIDNQVAQEKNQNLIQHCFDYFEEQ